MDQSMEFLGGIGAAFGLGFVYFVSAIPAGMALGAPAWLCAVVSWAGYSLGGVVVVLLGEPLRQWLTRKFKIKSQPEKPTLIRRAWDRFGIPAVGVLAPVTIGPQATALLGIALGVPKWKLLLAISLGVIPWCIGIAVVTALGFRLAE